MRTYPARAHCQHGRDTLFLPSTHACMDSLQASSAATYRVHQVSYTVCLHCFVIACSLNSLPALYRRRQRCWKQSGHSWRLLSTPLLMQYLTAMAAALTLAAP